MLKRNFWTTEGETSFEQTCILFSRLKPFFNETIRTWLFIKDIDNTYKEVSTARNEIFDTAGIKEPYFASTGIGRPDEEFYSGERMHLVALIVPNLDRSELIHMSNANIMPHTKTYGVRFERGVIYRNNYIISGSASIDKDGKVKHKGNLIKQIHHALSNVDDLLLKYGETIQNAKEIISYVRNPNDIETVRKECLNKMPYVNWIVKQGTVCRTDWLVEFETTISR